MNLESYPGLAIVYGAKGATEERLGELEREVGAVPHDYKNILRQRDGLECFVGGHYLVLWSAEGVPTANRDLNTELYIPGILLIGSDGANEGYGLRRTDAKIEYVNVPLVGMKASLAVSFGRTFSEFLMHRQSGH